MVKSGQFCHLQTSFVKNFSVLTIMDQISAGSKQYVSVHTQCGDALTVDEENIVVMVKSFSPVREIIEDDEMKVREREFLIF